MIAIKDRSAPVRVVVPFGAGLNFILPVRRFGPRRGAFFSRRRITFRFSNNTAVGRSRCFLAASACVSTSSPPPPPPHTEGDGARPRDRRLLFPPGQFYRYTLLLTGRSLASSGDEEKLPAGPRDSFCPSKLQTATDTAAELV